MELLCRQALLGRRKSLIRWIWMPLDMWVIHEPEQGRYVKAVCANTSGDELAHETVTCSNGEKGLRAGRRHCRWKMAMNETINYRNGSKPFR